MDVSSIISREEFESFKSISYEQFLEVISNIVKLSVEESLRVLPMVVTHLAKQSTYISNLSEKFYKENPDLVNHKELVSKTVEQVEKENPGKTYKEILSISLPRIRGNINQFSRISTYKNNSVGII